MSYIFIKLIHISIYSVLLQELKIAHSSQFRQMKASFEVHDLKDRRRGKKKKKKGERVEKVENTIPAW